MVTVYIAAVRLVADCVVCEPGIHRYVYGEVPPEGVTVALPLFPPLQVTVADEVTDAVRAAGSVIFIVAGVAVHPLLSVTVTV
jgi:hypothetical protein